MNTFEAGYQCAVRLLEKHSDTDAIMTAVDIYGMAALRLVRERNIPVPEQIRIVSLTGCSVGHLLEKSLTSFEIPAKLIGETAAKMVIAEIEAPKGSKPPVQSITLPASLSERESS